MAAPLSQTRLARSTFPPPYHRTSTTTYWITRTRYPALNATISTTHPRLPSTTTTTTPPTAATTHPALERRSPPPTHLHLQPHTLPPSPLPPAATPLLTALSLLLTLLALLTLLTLHQLRPRPRRPRAHSLDVYTPPSRASTFDPASPSRASTFNLGSSPPATRTSTFDLAATSSSSSAATSAVSSPLSGTFGEGLALRARGAAGGRQPARSQSLDARAAGGGLLTVEEAGVVGGEGRRGSLLGSVGEALDWGVERLTLGVERLIQEEGGDGEGGEGGEGLPVLA